jgi:hypothetical protein
MVEWKGYPRDYPALIHTIVDLRGLSDGECIATIEANGQKNLEAGLNAVAHSFDPVSIGNLDTPNTLIGRYTPNFHSPEERNMVDVKSIVSLLLGIKYTPPFGVEKAPRRKRCHLFLIRRKAEWHRAWDSLINKCHHDLVHDVNDDTWFEEEYEKEFIGCVPSSREIHRVKTPEVFDAEVTAKRPKRLPLRRRKMMRPQRKQL